MRSHTCPKCQSGMAEGFVASEKGGIPRVNGWSEGPPQKSWWGIIKLSGKQIPIATWRCPRCGYLEQYAPN